MSEVEIDIGDLGGEIERAVQSIRTDRIMAQIESIILLRTQRGEFLSGSSSGAGSYSTDPFARPAGGLPERVHDIADQSDDVVSYFTKAGDLWMVFERGYKQLRQMKGLPSDSVDLRDRGTMLDGMRSQARSKEARVEMDVGYIEGYSPAESVTLAEYHNRLGAGPNKVIRRFVGLTEQEEKKVTDQAMRDVDRGMDYS